MYSRPGYRGYDSSYNDREGPPFTELVHILMPPELAMLTIPEVELRVVS